MKLLFLALALANGFVVPNGHQNQNSARLLMAQEDGSTEEVDCVVIGSGLAGLSCAALLSHCEKKTVVLESHDAPGGCTHSWSRRGFHFESGPSLYSGFRYLRYSFVFLESLLEVFSLYVSTATFTHTTVLQYGQITKSIEEYFPDYRRGL